ncbi:MAG TPA: heavy metal-associated domain-containing protein [Pseudogracilibacillus sp.]|nr:heavy metal-associated domain-containing protein [Pseudogracilibacillus sp.]
MDVKIFIKQKPAHLSGRKLKEILESFVGIHHAHVHLHRNLVEVVYNPEITTLEKICHKMEELGLIVDRS